MNMPMPGRTRNNKAWVDPASADARRFWMRWMSLRSMTAATPLAIPTSSDSIRSLLRSCMFLKNVSSLRSIFNEKRPSLHGRPDDSDRVSGVSVGRVVIPAILGDVVVRQSLAFG